MFAPIIAVISSFIDQLGSSIIKKSENEPIYPASVWESGLLVVTSGSLIIFAYVFIKGETYINPEKAWLFIPRVGLEILQIYVTYTALKLADLSSFNFLRVFSIVFVVFIEILFLGSVLRHIQYLGVIVIFVSTLFIFRHGIKQILGWKYLIFSAINGGLLNVIAKYQFTFNNPYLNEAVVRILLILFLALIVKIKFGKNKLGHTRLVMKYNKSFIFLIPIRAVVGMLNIAALNLGAAAVYSTAERAGSVLSGVALGHTMFKEKSLVEKILVALGITLGLILLVIG